MGWEFPSQSWICLSFVREWGSYLGVAWSSQVLISGGECTLWGARLPPWGGLWPPSLLLSPPSVSGWGLVPHGSRGQCKAGLGGRRARRPLHLLSRAEETSTPRNTHWF